MLHVAGDLKYPAYFHDTLVQLSSDTHEDVRVIVAAQLLDVVHLIPNSQPPVRCVRWLRC